MKIFKWHTEYTITLLVLFALALLFMPTTIKSTVQANNITKWKDCYKKLTYAQDAILKQEQSDILTSLKKAASPEDREELIIQIIKPYIRLNDTKVPKKYKVKYLNKSNIAKNDSVYTYDYYYTDDRMIVGIKDLPDKENTNTKFIMTFDVNGTKPPNLWGKDVFGVEVYSSSVEPIGSDMRIEEQNADCSNFGTGVSCSNYYLIGGDFND